jgi:hypothetical protein
MFALSHDEFGLKSFVVSELKASAGFWFLVVGIVAGAIALLAQI